MTGTVSSPTPLTPVDTIALRPVCQDVKVALLQDTTKEGFLSAVAFD